MTVYPIQSNFISGELSPKLHGRVDLDLYQSSLTDAENWIVMPEGGVTRRPGSLFLCELRDEDVVGRVMKFEFSEEQAYAMILNDGYIRFATNGALVGLTAQDITGITKADPAVVTYSGSDTYANGDRVRITDVVGMTEVNNREFIVANVNTGANTFELQDTGGTDIDSTGYTTYSSGGSITEVVEIAHSYADADLFEIHIAQSADTVYLAHQDYAQRLIVRASETSWSIDTVAFENGPWLTEATGGTTMTPATMAGSVVAVDMTANSTSSYTAADSDTSANAYKAFDRNLGSDATISTTSGWLSIDFPSTNTKIADAYWIAASVANPENAPTHWTFEGYNGSSWVVIDARSGETAWSPGEIRYYEFPNATAFQSYRLQFYAVDGGSSFAIAHLTIHEEGDSQTAFNLTASAITGINGNAGFKTTDVDRLVRLLGSDGVWRWARIIARTSTTVVTIKLYGHALLDAQPIVRWQLSSWSADDGYAATVSFFDDRLGWAGSITDPRSTWLSQSSDYLDHGISDPLTEADAIAATMAGGKLDKIVFVAEFGDVLIVGTGGDVKLLGASSSSEPFSSFNITRKHVSAIGAAALQPIIADTSLLYVDRYKKRVIEVLYANERGGFVTRPLSRLASHLYSAGIVEGTFQDDRFNLAAHVIADGTVAAMTYEAESGVYGMTHFRLAPSAADETEGSELLSNPDFDSNLTGWTASLWEWATGGYAEVSDEDPTEGSEEVTNGTFTSSLTGWTASNPLWDYDSGKAEVQSVAYGSELLTNGGFTSSLSGWNDLNNKWSWTTAGGDGYAYIGNGAPSGAYLTQLISGAGLTPGATFRVSFVGRLTGGSMDVYIGGALLGSIATVTAGVTYSYTFTGGGANATLALVGTTASGAAPPLGIDNVSVKRVYEFPATLSQALTGLEVNGEYRIRATLGNNAAADPIGVYFGATLVGTMTAEGDYEYDVTRGSGTTSTLSFRAGDSSTVGITLDDVSVKRLIPAAYPATLAQTASVTIGNSYKLRVTIAANDSLKSLSVYFGGVLLGTISAVQEHEFDVIPTSSSAVVLISATDDTFAGVQITSVSLKETTVSRTTGIESAVAVPSTGGAVIYMVVRRSVNGVYRRYVEYFAPRHETGDNLAEAVYFDCAFQYDGDTTSTITGVTWLIGETIGLLVDGVDVGDVTVDSSGTVTLPNSGSGSKIIGGLRYTSRLETLRPPTAGNRDGTIWGRQMTVKGVAADILDAKGLMAGTPNDVRPFPQADYDASAGLLNTGIFPIVMVDDNHESDGTVVISTNSGYPATVRAVVTMLDGAP